MLTTGLMLIYFILSRTDLVLVLAQLVVVYCGMVSIWLVSNGLMLAYS